VLFFPGSGEEPVRVWEAPYTPEPVVFERGPDSELFSEIPWHSYKFSFGGRHLAACDADGDGTQDLLIAEKRTVHVFRLEGEGFREMNAFEIPGKGKIFSLGAFTFPGDSVASIVITTLEEVGVAKVILTAQGQQGSLAIKVQTLVYKYADDTGYGEVWKAENVFGRTALDGIYLQEYSDANGFEGPIRKLVREPGGFGLGPSMDLPKGMGLYDFVVVDEFVAHYSRDGYILISRRDGSVAWNSDKKFGGGETTVSLPVLSKGLGKEVLRRIPLLRAEKGSYQVFVFRNNPFLGALPGLGFSSVDLAGLVVSPAGSAEEAWRMERVPGRLVDMTVLADGRMAVLLVPYVHFSDPIFDPADYVQPRSAVLIMDTRER